VNDDWTVFGVDHADLEQTSGGIGTDEHREPVIEVLDKDRIVERMHDVVIVDAMFACAGRNERRVHTHKLACEFPTRKLPCVLAK